MSGSMNHSPGQIIQRLLIDLGHGTEVADADDWPVYYGNLPDAPDQAILVSDTEMIKDARMMYSGEVAQHDGFQVLVRGKSVDDGYTKAKQILIAFDQDVYQTDVEIGGSTYSIQSINRTSDVMHLGVEQGTRRRLYSVNAAMAVTLIEETGTATY